MALSMVIIIQKQISFDLLNYLNFEYLTQACLASTPQRGLLAQPTPTA
jgi:hypothetical protein